MAYHGWLWHKVRKEPLKTVIGATANARRFWVSAMMEDYEKKNILIVQSLRNTIMDSTAMANTSIVVSCGLAAIITSTYSLKKPPDNIYGEHGELVFTVKFVTLLFFLLSSFVCHSLSIRLINQVNYLFVIPQVPTSTVTPEYVSKLLEKAFVLSTVGNRLLYTALPLVLWIFGPVPVLLCSIIMVPILYNHDFGNRDEEKLRI
ncbi:Protein of unknown function DUF599 [Dillenia turbinata]|uniref:Uncharacterized protein n=1 Tax=Dillenia turbinata TaxID=194707 RepID=A0AAN8ZA08_9MAGN